MKVSPALAVANGWGSTGETERLLHTLSRQVLDLLQETVRLTARVADLELAGERGDPKPEGRTEVPAASPVPYDELQRSSRGIELEIQALQSALAAAVPEFATSQYLDYRKLLVRIQEVVAGNVPADSVVLVVSKGDDELLGHDGRQGWHFPREQDGSHPGYNPPDSEWAIARLEELRAKGAQYLLIPSSELWWLDHYGDFSKHLADRYPILVRSEDVCLIFALDTPEQADS
jgi:hypothetical protein